jgi:flagellar biosynthesis/type III secretory pathway chaperone
MSLITTSAEAEAAIDRTGALVEQLSRLMEEETALVRAGNISKATALATTKSQLAHELFSLGEKLKANAKFLRQAVPARCTSLRRMQEAFGTVLQRNLIVLATTHAVSEAIVRRLSGDLARKRAPQVYGASGRTTAPGPKYGQPLAVSRSL